MSLRDAVRRLLGARDGGDTIRVHVLLKGRTGTGWYDVDEQVPLPAGATLGTLLATAGAPRHQAARGARDQPAPRPHADAQRRALPGGREPATRPMADGDEVYLLAPLAGG